MLQKFIKFFSVLFFIFLVSVPNVTAQEKTNLYLFWGEGCPHCAKEKTYLEEITNNNKNLNLETFEIYKDKENSELLKNIATKMNISIDGVPILIIGDKHYIGFSSKLSPKTISNRIDYCLESNCYDPVKEILESNSETTINNSQLQTEKSVVMNHTTEQKIELPFIGEINLKKLSLPGISILLGIIDGFNPCAMWTLLFLISLLLGMKNKKRMWLLGTLFIITSALVYFLFMSAWLNLLLFLGFIIWVRIIIGIIALGGGSYNLKEFFTSKTNSGCKVTKGKEKQLVFEKLKKITQQHNIWLAVLGIILLAFAVNLVELICSAGLPAIFIQILAINDLSTVQYYSYILLYILFFMIDDLFIFFVAMLTLQMTGITTKYTRVTKLVGGIIMLIIGIILLLKPELLMFG